MSTTQAEQALSALAARLRGIRTTAGFHTDLGAALDVGYLGDVLADDTVELPRLVLEPQDYTVDKSYGDRQQVRLQCRLVLICRAGEDAVALGLRLVADVAGALRRGLAVKEVQASLKDFRYSLQEDGSRYAFPNGTLVLQFYESLP